jgi:hypothetical protein
MQTKERKNPHLRARSARLRLNNSCCRSNFLHKGDIQGYGHLFGFRLVGGISDRCNLGQAVQAATIFLGSRPALLLLNHKVGNKMHEHEKRMLFPTVSFPVTASNVFKDLPKRNA